MPPRDEDKTGNNGLLTQILVQVEGTREGVEYLKSEVKDVKERLKDTVPRTECQLQHKNVADALTRVEQVLAKKQTGTTHPSVTAAMLTAGARAQEELTGPHRVGDTNPNFSLDDIEAELKKRDELVIEKKRRIFMFYLTAIGALATLLGGLGAGVYKVVTYMSRLDERMIVQTQEIKKERQQQKIVYVPVPSPNAHVTVVPDETEPNYPTPVPPRVVTKKAAKKGPR